MRTSGECELSDTSENSALSIPFALSIYCLAIYSPRSDILDISVGLELRMQTFCVVDI
jgi:hypothetical protein